MTSILAQSERLHHHRGRKVGQESLDDPPLGILAELANSSAATDCTPARPAPGPPGARATWSPARSLLGSMARNSEGRGVAKSALQACLINDQAHLTRGASGEHVGKLQFALFATDGLGVEEREFLSKSYGPSTAAAVLAYKTRRSIINRAYQSTPDDIVGKMTIAVLDREMLSKEGHTAPVQFALCGSDRLSASGRVATGASSRFGAVDAQNASSRDSLVNAPGALPHEKALDRVAAATLAIQRTRLVLARLIAFQPITGFMPAQPSLPPGTMALFDKVWRNFGEPTPLPITAMGQFPPINTLTDFLTAIDSHYTLMQSTLTRASSLFQTVKQDVLGKTTLALTVTTDRASGDPPDLPVGIHFGELFAASGTNKQTEIVVHEASHFKDGHFFGDPFAADSDKWGKFGGAYGILNCWSYSMFVLDVVFNRTTPFPQ
jgi:hypothetical protein